MQTKQNKFTLRAIVIVLLLMITVTSVAVAADGLQVANPKIVREVTTTLSEIDKDWPIVKIERTEEYDSKTDTNYITVLVVRHSPAKERELNNLSI